MSSDASMSEGSRQAMDKSLGEDGDARMYRPSTPDFGTLQRRAEIEETPPSQRPRPRDRARSHSAVTSNATNEDDDSDNGQVDTTRSLQRDSPEIGEGSEDQSAYGWPNSAADGHQMLSSLDGSTGSAGDEENASTVEDQLPEMIDWSMGQAPTSGQKSPGAQKSSSSEINNPSFSSNLVKGEIMSDEEEATKGIPLKRRQPSEELGSDLVFGLENPRPTKKARSAFRRGYLALLNEDIEHAASRCVPFWYGAPEPRGGDLQASQIGLTVWAPPEKERFFEALGRLGRHDAAGIAERVQTKGELEVRQYMKLLQSALSIREQQNELEPLTLADFPAANELSEACCEALEEAADAIAVRQERFEDAVEEDIHGHDWLVSQDNYDELPNIKLEADGSETADIFNLRTWLSLSERFFMNAPAKEGNWQFVDGGRDQPSIRLTTLEDLQSLAVTLTKRLVTATIYMASSRLRSERGYKPKMVNEVKPKDVHAAVKSLGLATTRPPLIACVRRLGLSVYEEPPKPDEEDEGLPLSYEEVDAALGIGQHQSFRKVRHRMQHVELSPTDASSTASSDLLGACDVEEHLERVSMYGAIDSEEEEEIRQEAQEAIIYSAVDPPQSKRARQTLFRRIKAERAAERYADNMDAQASYEEEKRMWEVLAKEPPTPIIKPEPPPPDRRLRLSVDAGYSSGKDGRAGMETFPKLGF